MEVERISYGWWDGSPSLLVTFEDGRVYGFSGSPDGGKMERASAPDIAVNASVMSEEAFKMRFPHTILPEL